MGEEYATNQSSAVEQTSPGLRAWAKERVLYQLAECAKISNATKLTDFPA